MADRVSYRAEGEFPDVVGGSSSLSRPTVEIRTKDGTLHSRQVKQLPGDPKEPVAWEFLKAKFRDCVAFSEKPVAQSQVERAIRAIRELEQASDVTDIVRLLT